MSRGRISSLGYTYMYEGIFDVKTTRVRIPSNAF